MNLLIIGNSVLDTIKQSGKSTIKPGGIYYTAYGMNLLRKQDDKFSLATQISKNSKKYFDDVFESFDLSCSSFVGEIPNVELTIFDNKEREELYKNFSRKIDLDKINFKDSFDGIFINMITGNDISENDLINLRQNFNCPIYIDIHSLAKKLNKNNVMELRQIPDAERWFSNVDIVQANELELKSIINFENENMIAEYILSLGVKYLIVTRGASGTEIFWSEHDKVFSKKYKALKSKALNKVGCGDLLGAVFFYTYLKSQSAVNSLKIANKIAGYSTNFYTLNELKTFLIEEKIIND